MLQDLMSGRAKQAGLVAYDRVLSTPIAVGGVDLQHSHRRASAARSS